MLQGEAYSDSEDVLQGSADALVRIHSYEGAQLQEALVSVLRIQDIHPCYFVRCTPSR